MNKFTPALAAIALISGSGQTHVVIADRLIGADGIVVRNIVVGEELRASRHYRPECRGAALDQFPCSFGKDRVGGHFPDGPSATWRSRRRLLDGWIVTDRDRRRFSGNAQGCEGWWDDLPSHHTILRQPERRVATSAYEREQVQARFARTELSGAIRV